MSTVVAVNGVAPGVGTSSLARSLAAWLESRDVDVDLVEEDEILTRPAFGPVARELAVTATVQLDVLRASVRDFLATCTATVTDTSTGADTGTPAGNGSGRGAVVVSDGLFPFVRPLLSWGYNELSIEGFLHGLADDLGDTSLVTVYLDATVPVALRLAADREPEGWLEWYVDNLGRYATAPFVSDLAGAAGYLEDERDLTLRLLADGWRLHLI